MAPEGDQDRDDSAPAGRFSARWVRWLAGAVIVALIAVIALPYLLDWFSPAPSRPVLVLKPQPAPSLRPTPGEAPPQEARPLRPPPAEKSPPPQAAQKDTAVKPARTAQKAAPEQKPAAERPASSSARGGYWVQVGAFQDASNAARLAAQLTQEKYPLQRATVPQSSSGGKGHEVMVVGATADEVNDKLQGTTRKAVGTREGVLIQPALPLKEAVALSQELRADGLTVKIRRAQGTAALHTVRVGAYSDRSRAEAVRKELQEKGFSGFIVREPGGG